MPMCQKSRRLKFMQIHYIDKIFDCSVSRGQVRMIQLRKKTVEFRSCNARQLPQAQQTERIIDFTVVLHVRSPEPRHRVAHATDVPKRHIPFHRIFMQN